MPIPLLAIAAAGAFAKGVAGIASGFQQGKSLAAQAQAARIEGEFARIRKTQGQANSREQMATTLAAIMGVRSARGAGLDSQTGMAIERRTRQDFYRQEAIAALAETQRAGAAMSAARGLSSASRWAVPISVLGAAGDFASAAGYMRGGR